MLWWTSRQLKDDDWKVREAAAKKLGELPDAHAVESLMGALKDLNPRVRQAAVASLVRIGHPAVRPLVAALKGKHAEARLAAASALVQIGNPAVQPLGVMLSDRDVTARETAAVALGEIATDEALRELLVVLDQGDSGARESAAAGLVRIGARTIPLLIDRLKNGKPRVCETAAAALVRIGRAALNPLIAALKENEIREAAIEVLWKIDPNWAQSAAAREAVPAVIETLKGDDERLRRTSATVLGQVGGTRALEPLFAALADPNGSVQEAAASALGEIGDPRALAPLIHALQRGDDKARNAVSAALVRIGNTIIEPLVQALKSKDASIRETAAAVLVRVGHSVIEPLVDALWKIDPEWGKTEGARTSVPHFVSALKNAGGNVFKNPKDVLRRIGDSRVIKPLATTLKEMQDGLGKAAVSVGQVKGARDVDALAQALENADSTVRKSALDALMEIGSSPEDALVAALSSRNHVIRRAAAHALAGQGNPRSRDVLRCDLMDSSALVVLDAAESLLHVGDTVIAQPLLKLLKQGKISHLEPETLRAHMTNRILRLLKGLLETHAGELELEDLEAISGFDEADHPAFVPSTKLAAEIRAAETAGAAESDANGLEGWAKAKELARREQRRRRGKLVKA
ncbi:MAG: HEAT repeat domain-containing protein [Verrucomicrobia bacterium]|nr:HEAT repeat domain-containing protein [Verrucomicrobiota bacterium]